MRPSEAARNPALAGALDAIVLHRKEWKGGISPRLQSAIDACERAVKLDPNFAAAWAALAEICQWGSGFDDAKKDSMLDRNRQAAERALSLEPTNAQALAALGNLHFVSQWELGKAEPYLRSAVEINPRSTGIQRDYADLLVARGQYDDAVRLLRQSQVLEPTSARPSGAIAAYAAPSEGSLGYLFGRTGKRQEALKWAAKLEDDIAIGRRREVFTALVHTGLGEKGRALDLLEHAWERRDPNLLYVPFDARFQRLAGETRFQALLKRLEALRQPRAAGLWNQAPILGL